MTQLRFSLHIGGLVLLSTLACSDRMPTEPAPAATQGALGAEAAVGPKPRRSAPHLVAPRASTVPLGGRWGGNDVGLTIETHDASLEFGCAGGIIEVPFVTDSSGRFDLLGSWWATPPVIPENWLPAKRPASYSGTVVAGVMTLTVTRLDDGEFLGTFTLELGRPPRLVHCA